MNIIDRLDIKKIILDKARYQKVMLLYDDSVSNVEISNIYNSIKDNCIYNHLDLTHEKDILAKVNDGYKVLIFLCSVDIMLSSNIPREDFINIYVPTDNSVLPYYLNSLSQLEASRDYLVLNTTLVDISSVTSIYFNKFYNYLRNLLVMKPNDFAFNIDSDITTRLILDELDSLKEKEFIFADIELIKKCNIPYHQLPLVDYILITALFTLVKSVRTHSLSLVDVYKSAGEDNELVDKFYAMYNNELLVGLINLNFYFLSTAVEKTREKILEILSVSYRFDASEIDQILSKIKNYAKFDQGIFGYLYLYNIFSL